MKVLAYIETEDGKVRRSSLELLSYATDLAGSQNGSVTVCLSGRFTDETRECLARYGAQKIMLTSSDSVPSSDITSQAGIIAVAAEKAGAGTVLFTGSVNGRALAPVVAAKMESGLVSGIYSLPVQTDPFIINKKIFSGKAIATVTVKTARRVLVLLPNTYRIKENPVEPEVTGFQPPAGSSPALPPKGIRVVDFTRSDGQAKLAEAGVVVSGGRGIAARENWKYVEELAGLLGGATACSRPAYDEGWCPHDGWVGQTGKVISPNIYLALGISGAVQHLAGVSSSKMIVAVNKDPEAPIFRKADYGIVGDIKEVMPKLIEAVKKQRQPL